MLICENAARESVVFCSEIPWTMDQIYTLNGDGDPSFVVIIAVSKTYSLTAEV